jgi:hypothetical protein
VDVFKSAADTVQGKVLKQSGMKPLTGTANLGKGFVLEFQSGHVGMVQRVIGSNSNNRVTKKGYQRWTTGDGRVEKLQTMGSPSATAMHRTIWPEVEPLVEEYLQTRLDAQVEKVLERAARKART